MVINVASITRMANTPYGNPVWKIVDVFGNVYRTRKNSNAAYSITGMETGPTEFPEGLF